MEFLADYEKVDATIEALHRHLCKAVEGFMQEVGPGAEWDMEAK